MVAIFAVSPRALKTTIIQRMLQKQFSAI